MTGAAFQPLYTRVQDRMRQRIATAEWAPGLLLPNEFALAAEFEVSQGTVRKALLALEAERLIERKQGRGTYVSRHTPQRSLHHFFRIGGLDDGRLAPLSTVLAQQAGRATAYQAARLEIGRGDATHVIKRIRSFDGCPAIFERIVVPVAVMPGLALPRGPQHEQEMYVIYQQDWGVTIARATERLAAVAASAEEARRLRLPPGAPLLEVERVARDIGGRAVELRTSRIGTDRCRYQAEVF